MSVSTLELESIEPGSSTAARSERTAIVHVCNGLDPIRDGGMVPSILGMTGAIARIEGGVTIVTPTPSRLDLIEIPPGVELLDARADFEAAIESAEIAHLHGLWQVQTRRGAAAARAARVPHLIAAHGMADPWALKHKYFKKQVYLSLVEKNRLQNASCLHALSRPEIGHLRAIAPRAPIAFIPNGVEIPADRAASDRAEFEATRPELAGKFHVLFLGRLHVKKGLDLLAEAAGSLCKEHKNLHFLIAGPDDGERDSLMNRVKALGIEDRVTELGHVRGRAARLAWASADAFVLPSYSEGFSMAVLESLANRTPTLITTACHFPEVALEGAGVVVDPTVAGVTAGLRSLLERSPAELAKMGENGRKLVVERYTWDRQGEKLASVYRWLRSGGTPPECVQFPGDIR
jgi:glycosyltransferase involved in cell wall biosynthesis